mmetsp:Transcript_43702/g.44390  ORF Transcript_43702/g.44390 Transcript_43702/m.44390 type:complete len:92 (-) Transcript_43702:199-474(-)
MPRSTSVKMKNPSKYEWRTFFSPERVYTSKTISDDVRNTDAIVERPVDIVVPITGTRQKQIIRQRKKYLYILKRDRDVIVFEEEEKVRIHH